MIEPQQVSSKGHHIQLDRQAIITDANARLIQRNHRKVKMTPTEYRICLVFFEELQQRAPQVKPWMDGLIFGSYVSQRMLQQRCHLANQKVLRKHICHINRKLEVLGIHLFPLYAWGFLLIIRPINA